MFPYKIQNSLEQLFHRTTVNSLTTLTIKFNFVENIWNIGAWSNLKTYLEHIAWESCFPKIIFKIGLLSLEWQWGLLALNIIPIFYKNNVIKKTKIRSKKKSEQLPVYSAKATHGYYGSEIVVTQIFNLNHQLYTLQKFVVCRSQVEIGHTFTEISLNLTDFIDFF